MADKKPLDMDIYDIVYTKKQETDKMYNDRCRQKLIKSVSYPGVETNRVERKSSQ